MSGATSELGLSGPVSEIEVLAAVARAERHERQVTLREIANHLGWRYSGAATLRLRPPLGRLVGSGSLDSTDPPRRLIRGRQWTMTVAGRRQLASAGSVELPESPQHRRWRQDRDVAKWALEGVRAEAERATGEARDLLTDERPRRPLTAAAVHRVGRRLETALGALALATRICDEWPEPSDAEADDPPQGVSALLPDTTKKRRK